MEKDFKGENKIKFSENDIITKLFKQHNKQTNYYYNYYLDV